MTAISSSEAPPAETCKCPITTGRLQAPWPKKQAGLPLAPGHVCVSLPAAVASAPLPFYKELPLDDNNRVVNPQNAKRFARLYVGSFAVRLYRPTKRNKKYFKPPRPVDLNVVVIRELDPPAGKNALLWALFTSHV